MSRVVLVPVVAGDANTITSPNTTITNLSVATADIDGANVRLEAVDRRILQVPTNGFVNSYQDDSGTHDSTSITPNLSATSWTNVPTYNNGENPASLTVDTTNMDFAIIRCSFAVKIQGQSHTAAGDPNHRQTILYTRMTRDGSGAADTERAWQCNNLSKDTKSANQNVRQATYFHYVDTAGNVGNVTYRVQYKVDADGNYDGLPTTKNRRIYDMNFSAVVYREG